MDHPAALHRLKVGVPATVEHSSEAGPETSKWVAETTQVRCMMTPCHSSLKGLIALLEFHNFYGCAQIASTCKGSITSHSARARHRLCTFQG